MVFYDKDWTRIGTKHTLVTTLDDVMEIDAAYLTGTKNFRHACIAAKMSWAAGGKTTMIEDWAYSLLGIFSINLVPVYWERNKAFLRLERALLESTPDESLFA